MVTATKHQFIPSGKTRPDSIGRLMELCETCGKSGRGRGHDGFAGPRRITVPEALKPAKQEPWQLGMLKDAVQHVLDLPVDAIGWRMRLRVLDVQKAFDYNDDDLPLQRDPILEEPPLPARPKPQPTTRTSQRHASQKMIRGLPKDWKELIERAIDTGWAVTKARGHFKVSSPNNITVVIPHSPGEGRGYQNARAEFKRAGLNVEGL